LVNILHSCLEPQSRIILLGILNLKNHSINFKTNIEFLIKDGIIEMTVPDKPKNSNQKYVITEKGKKLLALIEKIVEK